MANFKTNDLLVAAVEISDGIFDQTVVLLLDGDADGTVGVVLNRLSTIELAEALPAWADLVTEPPHAFSGGPVSPQGAICLAEPWSLDEDPPGWRHLFARVGLLNLDTPVELAQGVYRHLRIFAGYAGWDAGQLDSEIELGMWHVVPARPEDLFDADPDTLWRRVLRRQGGDLALFSTWTTDPDRN